MESSQESSETTLGTVRWNRAAFFLTYSQVGNDVTKEQVLEYMQTKGEVEKYLIAVESHQDGGKHIHAYIKFSKKRNFKRADWADVNGYHPNISGAIRSDIAVSKYITKEDDDYITNYWKLKTDVYAEAFAKPTLSEALSHIKEKRPRDIALYGHNIENNMSKHFKKPKTFTAPEIELREDQQQLMEVFNAEPQPRKIHWIWSISTGAGKSTFLKYVMFHKNVLLGSDFRSTMYAYDNHDIIWFDVPRQEPLDAEFTSMLEKLANQMPQMSTKYVTQQKTVIAHIVVSCNRPPPHDKLPERIIEYDWNSYGISMFRV